MKNTLLLLSILIITFSSCHKAEDTQPQPAAAAHSVVYRNSIANDNICFATSDTVIYAQSIGGNCHINLTKNNCYLGSAVTLITPVYAGATFSFTSAGFTPLDENNLTPSVVAKSSTFMIIRLYPFFNNGTTVGVQVTAQNTNFVK